MVAFGGHAVHGAGLPAGFGYGGKTGLGEIRPVILFNGKRHGKLSSRSFYKIIVKAAGDCKAAEKYILLRHICGKKEYMFPIGSV